MLVLARGKRQRIFIGRDIVIEVLSIRGDTVRLGIAAPPEVVVNREEVHNAIRADRWAAAVDDSLGGEDPGRWYEDE